MQTFLKSLLLILLFALNSSYAFNSEPITVSSQEIVGGNPRGDITMAFVYDYQCGYCHEMYPIVKQLMHQFPDLRVVMMPVAVLNMTSLYEASAAVVATATGQFWGFTEEVMSRDPLSDEQVTNLLNQMGLNTQQFQYAMHGQVVKAKLAEGQKLINIEDRGTPLFFIYPTSLSIEHSEVIVGAQPEQIIMSAIRYVQEKSKSLY